MISNITGAIYPDDDVKELMKQAGFKVSIKFKKAKPVCYLSINTDASRVGIGIQPPKNTRPIYAPVKEDK